MAKALIYHNNMYEGEGYKEVTAHKVEVPFINAFAAKDGKYWHVYERSTGIRVTLGTHKRKEDAVSEAIEKLNGYGEAVTRQAIASKPKAPAMES